MKRRLLAILLLTLLVVSSAFATNGTRLIGFGPKMNGRGGTGIGVFDSPSLMMTNPAGLTFLDEVGIGANFAALMPTTHFKNNLNDKDGDRNTYPLGGIGYVNTKLQEKHRITWGVGAFTLGGMGADYKLNHALWVDTAGGHNVYDPQKYHSKLGVIQIGPSVAYQINEKLSVGMSLHLMYSTLEFEMPFSMSPSALAGIAKPDTTFGKIFSIYGYQETTAASKMSDLAGSGLGGKIGFAYKPTKDLSFGFNYTSPTTFKHTGGKAHIDMTRQADDMIGRQVAVVKRQYGLSDAAARHAVMMQYTGLGIDTARGFVGDYDLEAELTNPQSVGIGISYQANPKLLLAMDVEWINWKNAYDKIKLTLKHGDNPNINRMMGNYGNFAVDFPMDWKDAVMLRLGAEYMINQAWTVRGGYAYGSNPVPSSTLIAVFPAIIEHHLTVGCSYNICKTFSAHLAYEMALKKDLTADNPSIMASEYSGSSNSLSGSFVNLGFAWKL